MRARCLEDNGATRGRSVRPKFPSLGRKLKTESELRAAARQALERKLRAACEEHLGMGPIRYLTLRRMHLVRQALLHSHPSTATVTQTVTDHGFWELGRFSVAYRALFGETPSETLRQPIRQCSR